MNRYLTDKESKVLVIVDEAGHATFHDKMGFQQKGHVTAWTQQTAINLFLRLGYRELPPLAA